jgi:hypothetical protein
MNVMNNRRKLNMKTMCVKTNKQFVTNVYKLKINHDINYNKIQTLNYVISKPDNDYYYSDRNKYTNIE